MRPNRKELAVSLESLDRLESSEIMLDSIPEDHIPAVLVKESFFERKFFVPLAVFFVAFLTAALVILLVLFVSPVLKKDKNVQSIPTLAPNYKITLPKSGPVYNYFHTQGTQIIERRGQPIRFTGCNW